MRFIYSLIRSYRLLFFSTTLSICAITLKQDKALAWYEICNKTSQTVKTAFAYIDRRDNRANVQAVASPLSLWVSEGWWNLNPGECTKVYPHELWRRNQYYYVYAERAGGGYVWSGKHSFCIARGTAFTIRNADLSVNTSSPGNVPDGCYIEDRNIGTLLNKASFFQVDIGRGRTQNYTTDLTD
jgi:uncharacterized membrane protein